MLNFCLIQSLRILSEPKTLIIFASCLFVLQVKSGVKRKKADTTTPGMTNLTIPDPVVPAKIPARRESSQRTIKKPVKDLPIDLMNKSQV